MAVLHTCPLLRARSPYCHQVSGHGIATSALRTSLWPDKWIIYPIPQLGDLAHFRIPTWRQQKWTNTLEWGADFQYSKVAIPFRQNIKWTGVMDKKTHFLGFERPLGLYPALKSPIYIPLNYILTWKNSVSQVTVSWNVVWFSEYWTRKSVG